MPDRARVWLRSVLRHRHVPPPAPLAPRPAGTADVDPKIGVQPFPVPQDLPTGPPSDLLVMGEHSYNQPMVQWYLGDTHQVRIGRYCSIHSTVSIFVGGEHRVDHVTSYALRELYGRPGAFRSGLPHSRGDVVIGSDVYVGFQATILSGVTVGDGAVIGANAVVTRSVPAFSVWVGNPARQARWRFAAAERESLARIAWWDWPDEQVAAAVDLLASPDVSAFCRAFDPLYVEPSV